MARAVVSAVAAASLFMTAACSASDEPHSTISGEKQQITDILGLGLPANGGHVVELPHS
ncbi:hypothetical protein [Corynebacterium evansiae]|uniref:hypothetical protein n=1 Tax=Corynebacterium evansiae TaxID=2913499 RepID=UPI003EC0184B